MSITRFPNTVNDTQASTAIISGTVTQVGTACWTIPDGTRPTNPWTAVETIFTPITVSIGSTMLGSVKSPITVMALGGRVGQDSVTTEGDDIYTFTEGDRVILFLDTNTPTQIKLGIPLYSIIDHNTLSPDNTAHNIYRRLPAQQLLDEVQAAIKL